MFVTRLLQSEIATHSFESGVFGAGKHLKHAGQVVPKDRFDNHWPNALNNDEQCFDRLHTIAVKVWMLVCDFKCLGIRHRPISQSK